jgi:hypothetical protein
MASYKDGLFQIIGSIQRRKGSFNVSESPGSNKARPFAVAVGAPSAIDVPGGMIVSVDMSREQLEKMRDACDELLKREN